MSHLECVIELEDTLQYGSFVVTQMVKRIHIPVRPVERRSKTTELRRVAGTVCWFEGEWEPDVIVHGPVEGHCQRYLEHAVMIIVDDRP